MRSTKLLLIAALAAAPAPAALGQNALGAGRALDGNLQVGSQGVNTVADRFVDTRVRNPMVTGNVPSGRQFRGVVGYTAPRDFRGQTGGDGQFDFRADSALSAGSLTRFGSQYDALRFGGGMDRATFRRDFTVTNLPSTAGQDVTTQREQASAVRLDTFVPASEIYNEPSLQAQPQVVGVLIDQSGGGQGPRMVVEASPLRGLQAMSDSIIGTLNVYDRLLLEENAASGVDNQTIGAPFVTSFDRSVLALREETTEKTRPDAATDALAQTQRVDTLNGAARQDTRVGEERTLGEYQDILVRIAERYADQQNVTWNLEPRLLEYLGDDYEALRDRLAGRNRQEPEQVAAADPATPPGATGDDDEAAARREEILRRLLPSRRGDEETADGAEETEDGDLERFGRILRHGQRVDHFVTDVDRGRFEQLVREAEKRLAAGEYFNAEQRFARALRFVPGHPLATAGLGHAQLGAGLYRSSALSLRALLTGRPEMIGVRYADSLLPNVVRLGTAADEIRERGDVPGQEGLSGFLLAYIGFQTENAALVDEGLDSMESANPDDSLIPVLRGAWTE